MLIQRSSIVAFIFAIGLLVASTNGAEAFFVKKDKEEPEISIKNQKDSKLESEKTKELKAKEDIGKKHDTVALLATEKGNIRIKLYMDEAPITAGNFKDLVERHFYDGLNFHRVVPGFVIQGGCPHGNGTGNFIDPESNKTRYIKMESTNLKHDKEGVVAMARTANPDSASSQFFIDLAPQPFLNAGGADQWGYAIFGQVIEGMDVVHQIVADNVAPAPGSDGAANPVKIKYAKIEK